ncbi:helix-hairpin-helix domain-containing protein [Aporhodopirellula aestuarii]|uniref:Helix-hairpin-helix domain-containing protein n=1 Tax=Aporhodopirellula aestuarii TaxID=2950107 RepID=A0ABT0TZ28_9BACT|nr:helix-hairpin-helix domain-containing protein [Aporhodopirellula aestuarii]MCM2369859.1 helix-hairpin-helix domain-containing protein [Aporhodopirellula aestuarii]
MAVLHSSDPLHASSEIEAIHDNQTIAQKLDEIANLLHEQKANEFRVRAYHAAAKTIRSLPTSVSVLLKKDGLKGLIALPAIGKSIANLIQQFVNTGRIPMVDRLRGESHAEQLFTSLPGIGPELSHRIHNHLHIETLSELDAAAWEGRLEQVPGIGRKRIQAIKSTLAQKLSHEDTQPDASSREMDRTVSIEELLDIDKEYRTKATAEQLPKIAPSKFNPNNLAWLPILHTERKGRHYTALFSNSARAHQLNMTRDWVVIFRDDADSHGSWTVITSQYGQLQGCRIVRGREDECRKHYKGGCEFHHPVAGQSPYPELPLMWDDGHGHATAT